MEYFDASVTFYEMCYKHLKHREIYDTKGKKQSKKKKNHQMRSQTVKHLLDKAIDIHDHTLKEYGQFGLAHRCNSQPFRHNMTNINEDETVGAAFAMNNTKSLLWYKNLGPRDNNSEEVVRTRIKVNYNCDNLCFGGQQKVTHCHYFRVVCLIKRFCIFSEINFHFTLAATIREGKFKMFLCICNIPLATLRSNENSGQLNEPVSYCYKGINME